LFLSIQYYQMRKKIVDLFVCLFFMIRYCIVQHRLFMFCLSMSIFQLMFSACNLSKTDKLPEKLYYYNTGELRMKKFIDPETKTFEGVFYMWHKNGKRALKGNLVNNERQGEIIYYDKEEIPNCYAYYDNGKKHGKWIYLEKGDTTKIATFENGILIHEEKK